MTAEQRPVWATYVDQALERLDMARETQADSPAAAQAHAQRGIGWALLALVEVLKPAPDEVLVVERDRVLDGELDGL